jgi:molybdate transport system substrate-binding protein
MRALADRFLLAYLVLFGLPIWAASAPETELTVFAASSLTNVMDEVGAAFTKATARPVRFSYAASSALARQIESGAGADVFFSADLEWMDYLQSRNLIQEASRRDVVGNHLVLIAPAGSKLELKIAPNFALLSALDGGRLATGDPDSVPVGRYARAALMNLGVWNAVADRLVRADNVRSSLAFVERSEAPLGIVYATDAAIDRRVRVVDVFPENTHPPIRYPIALTKAAKPEAARFVEYMNGADAQELFKKYGFVRLK